MSISVVVLPLSIIFFSFSEILVFNEEVLLALCFVAFVFYAYSSLGQSAEKAFADQSVSIEAKFLLLFGTELNVLDTAYRGHQHILDKILY